MVLFAGFGYGVFTHGKGSFLPIREQPKFVAGKPVVSLGYPKFDPLIYSLDTLVPFANLGQRDYWAPNRSRDGGRLSWTPPKTSWRAPRDHDSVELIANGGVGCGVRPGSSILRSV